MKSKFLYVLSVLFFAFSLTAWAAQKDSGSVTFTEPVNVGSTVLSPGHYKVKWEGTGSDVQVSFLQGKRVITTTSATVSAEANPFDGAIKLQDQAGNSKVLKEILWKEVSLTFGQSTTARGN